MFKPFANSARALAAGPLTWKTWTGLIAVPVLIMGLLTWALWSPDSDHGTATAAVVNNDEPVTVNGQLIPLGRQLTGDLTHSSDSAYKWVLTDAADAASGLDNGTYAAVVTIPQDFSARATSAANGKPLDATRAVVDIKTSASSGVIDPALSQRIADGTQQTLNNQIVETYLDNIYVGFSTINGQINQAADGAKRLADGIGQLTTGSAQLSSGLTQAQRDTAQLPALTRKLADGAEQVAQGNEKLAGAIVPLANRIIAAIDALPSAKAAAADVQKLADQCSGDAQFCDNLRQAAARLTADADKIDGAKAAMRAEAVQVRDGIQALATGARQVANGNAQLAKQSGTLAKGIADAADGARQLDTGVQQANSGAQQLASSLDKGRNQVPDYTDAERSHLKAIAASPTTLTADSTSSGTLAITLFAVLALWALALATYLVTRAVPDAVLTSREPTWQIIVRAALPGATAAALAAVAITAMAIPALGLGVAASFEFLGAALLAAFAFVSLNQAVAAIFGRAGRLASLAVLVLGAATGIVSTLPSPFYALADYLPTHGAVLALRAAATGDAGLYTGIAELFGWLIVGVLAAILVTDRRRYLSTRQLRLA